MCTFEGIVSWIRKAVGFQSRADRYNPPESNSESISSAMIDLMVGEVKGVYTVLAKRDFEIHRSQVSLQTGGADYFWLVDRELVDLKLPEAKATELENLCYSLKADECNSILDEFRRKCLTCEKPTDAVWLFEQTVDEAIRKRPHSLSVNDWAKGVVQRRSVNAVTPDTTCKFESSGFVDFNNSSRPVSGNSRTEPPPQHLAIPMPPL